jgi:hypothetical protein
VLAVNFPVARLHRLRFDPDREAVEGAPIAFPRRFMAAGPPDVSADGKRLIFAAQAPQEDLAIQPLDGVSEPSLITQDTAHDHAPRWSRDGARIAFESDRDGSREIWIARADGSEPRKLAAVPEAKGELQPVWSADGKRIAVGSKCSTSRPVILPRHRICALKPCRRSGTREPGEGGVGTSSRPGPGLPTGERSPARRHGWQRHRAGLRA